MKVQFAAIIVESLNAETDVKTFPPKKEGQKEAVVANITVAEVNSDKDADPQYHDVQIWGRVDLHQYLVKGKIIQVSGDMQYRLAENGETKRKYYAVRNADIVLIADPKSKKTEEQA